MCRLRKTMGTSGFYLFVRYLSLLNRAQCLIQIGDDIVDVFDANGRFMCRLASGGGLQRPWSRHLCGPHWARWLIMANQRADADRALIMGHSISAHCRRETGAQ